MIYRGPFGGYTGKTISRDYDFRPVDSSDGLNHIAISDVHEAVDAAIAAATTRKDTDFIVLLGDLVSMVETEADAQMANDIAHGITGGEIPVIYARGNHEIKGEYAEVLYKYVGSKHQEYYYTVTLGDDDVFAVVLDLGEDHEDDYWEYYGTAQFDLYRAAQTEMLEEILEEGSYENYRYRMMLCHIPVVYVDKNGYFEEFRNDWTALLNEMDLDIGLSGHKHVMWPLLPGQVEPNTTLVYSEAYKGIAGKEEGGYLIDFNFPNFLVGRRSLDLADSTETGAGMYLCMATQADFASGQQTSYYVNSQLDILSGYYPFSESGFDRIVTELKRPEK
jgi:predicted phosphodiesterase